MSNTSSNYTAQKDDSKLKYKTGAWTAEEDVKLLEMVGNQKEIQRALSISPIFTK
jgi:hypothetical protein